MVSKWDLEMLLESDNVLFCSAPLDKLKIIYVGEDRAFNGCPLDAINGNMVYVCHLKEEADSFPEYLGLGLVRAVDEHVNRVYLVTGMKKNNLQRANCLALTSMPLPVQVLTSQSTVSDTDSSVVGYISQAGGQSVLFRNVIDRPFRTEAASKR